MQLPGLGLEDIREGLAGLDEEERGELNALLQKLGLVWFALPGPQSDALYSEADITGYGGAAGGGKTDLACGMSLTEHQRSIIYRREGAQLTAVIDRIEELVGTRQGYNSQKGTWRIGKRQVEFGGFPNLGDEKRYQGRPHDLKVFDEVTEMLEAQVRFLMGWLRSAKKGQRQRVLMNFNPPTTPEGRWVIKFFGPWLDRRHALYPTAPGALHWATTINGEDVWLPDGRQFVFSGSTPEKPMGNGERIYDFDPKDYRGARKTLVIQPLSRTFIPARVTDNPFYMESGYMAKLQALPEPLRSQMLYGDFDAGMDDADWQLIPTAWVRAAMDRWTAMGSARPGFVKPGQMDSMGVDVAMGGRDKFVIARRHGTWFDDLMRYPGKQVRSGATGAGLVVGARRDRAPVHIDVVGWGSDTYGALIANKVQSIPINGATGATALSSQGQRFINLRAQMWWAMREALDPSAEHPISIPDDTQLELDLTAPRYFMTRAGIQIEGKEEIKKRLGHSPDDGDALVLALMATLKDDVVIDILEELEYTSFEAYDRTKI